MRSSHDLAGWFGRGSLRRLATGFFSEAELSHEAGPPSKGFGPLPLVARVGLLTAICRNEDVSHLEKLIADKRQTPTGNPADWANEPQGDAQSAWLADGAQIHENYYWKEVRLLTTGSTGSLRIAVVWKGAFANVQHQEPQAGSHPVALDSTHTPPEVHRRVREAISKVTFDIAPTEIA